MERQPSNDADTVLPDRVALDRAAAGGAIPMITWEAWGDIQGLEPSRLATIPTGAFDDYIIQWARRLKAFGRPVFLRPFHEMNNPPTPGQLANRTIPRL